MPHDQGCEILDQQVEDNGVVTLPETLRHTPAQGRNGVTLTVQSNGLLRRCQRWGQPRLMHALCQIGEGQQQIASSSVPTFPLPPLGQTALKLSLRVAMHE